MSDLNKLRDEFEAWYCEQAARDAGLTFVPSEIAELREGDGYGGRGALNGKWEAYQALVPVLRARLQAAEERAEKVEGAMLNVQQQCENVVFNLRQRPYDPLPNKDAVTIFDRLATTLRVAALVNGEGGK